MLYFPKIETLFRRDENFKVIPGEFRNPIVETINEWIWTEKIDGMNTFIRLNPDNTVEYGGRSERTQMPPKLLKHLMTEYPAERLIEVRRQKEGEEIFPITFFGEGYGPGIQRVGNLYSSEQRFILFDVLIGDKWWLSDEQVTDIAAQIQMPRVPILGRFSIWAAIEMVEEGFQSLVSESPQLAEGLVGRTLVPLYLNNGRRLIIKVKTKDF